VGATRGCDPRRGAYAAGQSNDTAIDRAWAGALALILIVLVLNVVARVIARFTRVS
jgi:phosphate transport system permease protein